MGKISIKKGVKIFNRTYFYLIKDKKVIGKAWITNKTRYLFNGLYIKIIPEMRRKGYGRIFYKLLIKELSKNEVEAVAIWVNENNEAAVNFFENVTYKYSDRLGFWKYRGFVETLIVE